MPEIKVEISKDTNTLLCIIRCDKCGKSSYHPIILDEFECKDDKSNWVIKIYAGS